MKRIPIKLAFLIIAVLLCGSLLAGCAPGVIVDYFGTTAKMHYSKSEFTSFAVMESVEFWMAFTPKRIASAHILSQNVR